MKTTHKLVPFDVIVAATDGDTDSINRVVKHYSGFIAKRSLRPMKDDYGNYQMVVDEMLRARIHTRLITKILSFEIK
ncbi:MAG: hypothetical protein K0Q56_1321 [Sporolactobacillus laevolacticus]|jgi:hypothetical protein|nr:hypothetical protein [Sporolactobacillus laevolacticus]